MVFSRRLSRRLSRVDDNKPQNEDKISRETASGMTYL